jgi:hypothetical protein
MTEIKVGSKWIDRRCGILVVTSVDSYVKGKHPNGFTYSWPREAWLLTMRPVDDATRLSPEESGVLLAVIDDFFDPAQARENRVAAAIRREFNGWKAPGDDGFFEKRVRQCALAVLAAYEEPSNKKSTSRYEKIGRERGQGASQAQRIAESQKGALSNVACTNHPERGNS